MAEKKQEKLVIQVGSEKAEAMLLWEDAPNICRAIWEHLPIQSSGTHAKICNHELMFMLPFVVDRENLQQVKPGCVGLWDTRNMVNIWYDDPGPIGPLGPTALFAVVTKNLEGIGREIAKSWNKPGVLVKFEQVKE